jgi:hypothetical protein
VPDGQTGEREQNPTSASAAPAGLSSSGNVPSPSSDNMTKQKKLAGTLQGKCQPPFKRSRNSASRMKGGRRRGAEKVAGTFYGKCQPPSGQDELGKNLQYKE